VAAFERQQDEDAAVIKHRCPDIINEETVQKLHCTIAQRVETLSREYKRLIDEKHELLDRALSVA
jgi:hypothetical protein